MRGALYYLDGIFLFGYIINVAEWEVIYAPEFEPEYDALDGSVQDELVAHLIVLAQMGPLLGRPLVDTLSGSAYTNMKEIRFSVGRAVWRFAFAF